MHNTSAMTDLLFVFMLAAFLGFQLIKRVSPLLHSPLFATSSNHEHHDLATQCAYQLHQPHHLPPALVLLPP